jgi:hypothetical protein
MHFILDFLKNHSNEISGTLAGVLVFFIKSLRVWVVKTFKNLLKQRHKIEKKDIEKYLRINSLLSILLDNFKADRVSIYQFHNGSDFSLANPIWRVTNTHEVVRDGITPKMDIMANRLVTGLIPVVAPLITGECKEFPGVIKIENCESCKFKCQNNKHSFWYLIEDMRPSNIKYFFEEKGCKQILVTNICTPQGNIIGWIGVDFCEKLTDIDRSLMNKMPDLCELSCKIQYELTK